MNKAHKEQIKRSLKNILLLKNDPLNGDYVNGAVLLAERILPIFEAHDNAKAFDDAILDLRIRGLHFKSLRMERDAAKKTS
jgi:hypothetical protein